MVLNIIFAIFFSLFILYVNNKIKYKHDYPKLFIGISVALSVAISLKLTNQPQGLIITGLFTVLINITLIDFKCLEIPNTYNLIVFLFGVINMLILKDFSMIITGIISFILFFIIAIFSRGALGGGDIKLALGLGLFFKLSAYASFLMYTFGIGALIATVLLILKKKNRKDKIAFGPFMALGAILAILM